MQGSSPVHRCCLLLAAVSAVSTACVGNGSTYALYPNSGQKLAPEVVASLTGDVAYVDGIDVSSHGNSFEVLPGCHVVRPPERWALMSYGQPTMWATIGKVSFAMDMKAQHRYVVRIGVVRATGGSEASNVMIDAREESRAGAIVRHFRSIKGEVPPSDCTAALAANRGE